MSAEKKRKGNGRCLAHSTAVLIDLTSVKCSLSPVYTIQPVVKRVFKPVLQPVSQPVGCLFTQYSRLSGGCQTGLTTRLTTGCIV